MINRQPFQQIILLYPCNFLQTKLKLTLFKYLKTQQESNCPTQIKILLNENLLIINNNSKDFTENKSKLIYYNDNNSFNQSYFYYKKINKKKFYIKVCITKKFIFIIK